MMRRRVSSDTPGSPLSAYDTEPFETPAWRDVRRVVIRPVGMVLCPDAADARVDLHGVDVPDARGQRGGHVVAASRADDEHVTGGRLARAAHQVVRQPIRALKGADVVHVLVRDVVDVDRAL